MKRRSKTLNMIQCALMAAVICVCSMINFQLGPIPFSMSVFGIILAGTLLSPPLSLGAVAVYVAVGFAGLPVFSGGRGGPQVLAGPTGGYIVGYFFLAWAISMALQKKHSFANTIMGGAAGLLGCYSLGTLWFAFANGSTLANALALCVVPFIIPDLIKLAAAAAIAAPIKKALASRKMQG